MGLIVEIFFLMMKVCAIAGSLVLQESSGHEISPSPTYFPAIGPIIEGSSRHMTRKKQILRNPWSPTSPPNLQSYPTLPPSPSNLPAPYVHYAPSPYSNYKSTPPTKSQTPTHLSPVPKSKPRHYASPLTNPGSAVPPFYASTSPAISPSTTSPPVRTTMPLASPPTAHKVHLPTAEPPSNLPLPVVSHPRKLPQPISHNSSLPPLNLQERHVSPSPNRTISIAPTQHTQAEAPYVHKVLSFHNRTHHLDSRYAFTPPTISHPPPNSDAVPVVSPPGKLPEKLQPIHHNSSIPPSVLPAPSPGSYNHTSAIKSHPPPSISLLHPQPSHHASPSTNLAPYVHTAPPNSSYASTQPTKSRTPHSSPLFPPPPGPKNKSTHYAPPPPNPAPIHDAPSSYNRAPPLDSSYESTPPTKLNTPHSTRSPLYPPQSPPSNPASSVHNACPPESFESTPPSYPRPPPGPPWHHAPPPPNSGMALPPFHTSVSPAISPSATSVQTTMPFFPPKISPFWSPPKVPKPIQALPPPPPNEDCSLVTCKEPLTNTLPGVPCNCVMPMQIALSLGVALFTFFPLVSELASEMASGVYIKPNQVRIIGANADDQDPEKTIALIDLVPFGEKFDDFTAYLTAQRLWRKQVYINSSLFGDYEVLYVKYQGLPPSPPLPSSTIGTYGGPRDNNGMTKKPLGVDVSKQKHIHKLNRSIIAIIVLSAILLLVIFFVLVWILLFKRRDTGPPVFIKSSVSGSGPASTSASLSYQSSMACTGSAKTFSLSDMEKATDNFNEARVLGEGGFGRVYSGLLDDGRKVAVKVLKRVGKQGCREFVAEVEMLSRLHHRNLVTLIGFCTDDRNRCLVYELIPNGSVQSHLHGKDKETGRLDWAARLKIALGAARGLAYLHEDSSPRVIHRDFKSSNILLEHDFTPIVSDFGLARSALDEEGRHITTRIMGTFGYLAPEYAMTGHLLVKSDVYSYGVVLLELLTGRKPVDMSMPPGQENLVAWAQPLLMAPEGLSLLVDPMLIPDGLFDGIAKVAAIASMCVQTDVSQRPSMGEVVQALKLVCDEWEEPTNAGSTFVDFDDRVSPAQPIYSNHESPIDLESGCSVLGLGPDLGS